ncbi:flagellar M-ring protein FliF [Ferrimonas sediminicola]|uniref:Flagellar M-ring protein n=1 Tax=Ferrimonas sediminicola TaxID=2569538 RepID=A0A4U1BCM0_9GAMM|nr:flagellar basal-body MS-ring/collar protein FliF [Ferrimonas sediminicola]TKB47785.1 flagellar M-ring protein FliF [Ferrimonas sediminicola]
MSTVISQSAQPLGTLEGLKGAWRKFARSEGGQGQVLLVSVLAVVAAVVIVVVLWRSGGNLRPLYGNQEGYDSARIIEVLESEGIDYQIDGGSGQLLVGHTQVGTVRMVLAARGIKAQLPSGLDELTSDITSSQFMEQARYRHGLEGEMARTIMALDSVKAARVHLAIPKRTLFVRKQDAQVSASVMVDLEPGTTLSRGQVAAVVNLVAGSVPGLEPARVQLVDQRGELLAGDDPMGDNANGLSVQQVEYGRNLEQQLIQRAESMLLPVLGPRQYRVQVSADINFDQVEETQESVDPSVVLLQEKVRSNQNNGSLALGIPGALSNQPPEQNANGQATANQSTTLSEESSRSFEAGRSVRHTKYQKAQLQQLSVSVLLNERPEGAEPWTPAQQAQMAQMVKDAIGFDDRRGDQFSLSVFPFAVVAETPVEPLPWWQLPEYTQYFRYLIGGLVALCLIFFVLRPMVRHLIRVERMPAEAPSAPAAESVPELAPPQEEEAVQQGLTSAIVALGLPEPGSPLTVQLEHLGLLAKEEPARVAEVISKWIGAENRD